MDALLQDLAYGWRMLRKSPGFTALAVLTLALGIGANTAIFSNVNALVLRPFSFPDLDRVVAVWETVPKQNADRVKASPANFQDWRERSESFERLAAVRAWDANLTSVGVAERVEGYQVTEDFFPLSGIAPQLGRQIGSADFQEGIAPVVVISHAFWQKDLGGAADIVGKTLMLNGQKFTVIGVAGPDLDFPAGTEVWTPLDLSSAAGADRANHYLLVLGRLRKGSSIASAEANLKRVAGRLAQLFPNSNGGHEVRVASLAKDATQGTREFVSVLMGAAVFVLLLACVNVANLQLARISSRRKEMAVRIGLGASRWQLVRQLLVESVLLALAGAGAGILLSSWGMGLLRRDLPPFIVAHVPGLKHLEMDSRVLCFTLSIAIVTGVLAGLAPALRFSRSELGDALKENTRGSSASPAAGRLRMLLVVSEVALALVLLVGAGLMVKGFRHLLTTEMGFDRANVLTFHVALPEEKYKTKDQVRNYYDRLVRELQTIRGVESVACVSSLPSSWSANWTEYRAEGQPPASPGEMPATLSQAVTPDFFAALRISLLKGRFISAQDNASSPPVAVISESMAQRNWPGQDPIGKHVRLGGPQESLSERQIVGVVGDIHSSPFESHPSPTTYVPFAQMPEASTSLAVRTSGNPLTLASAMGARVRSIDPDDPAYDVRSLEQLVADDVSGVSSSARIMIVFGFVALVLAAAGIFAVMSYSVAQRTHEIGVRMALGAQRIDVVRAVVTSAAKMTAVGLSVGIVVALLLTNALSHLLFGVMRMDALTFILLTVGLALVAATAAYIPAHWATKVDPIQALRCE